MQRFTLGIVIPSVLTIAALAQSPAVVPPPAAKEPSKEQRVESPKAEPAAPIPADAPHITKQTRYEIIRDFETQIVYTRTAFPMGTKGLILKDGTISPNGEELRQMMAIYGPAVKVGDPCHISYVRIKDDHIHFEINGGPIHRKKWYQHIEVSGTGGPVTPGNDDPEANPHGSYIDLYFDKYVPEMNAQQLRDLLFPVLDFNARNKEQAYLDTVPPKVKEAILAHHVLVGMNQEMVVHAKGRPPKKVREKDGDAEFEEWIYGQPPEDVDFVRMIGDEVVRVETMRVSGEKILRTEREVILETPEQKEARKEPEERPATAPSLRRPGEDVDDVPKPANGQPPMPAPNIPPPPTPPSGTGPGEIVATR